MNEPIRLPEERPQFDTGNLDPEFDGCIIIKRCDEEAADQIMADFAPVTLTCIPDDAILVQVHTLDRGSILEDEL